MVGSLSTEDPDANEQFTYSLVAGGGDADNGLFTISDDQLVTTGRLDFETAASYSVRVQTQDGVGNTIEQVFVIVAEDVYDLHQPRPLRSAGLGLLPAQLQQHRCGRRYVRLRRAGEHLGADRRRLERRRHRHDRPLRPPHSVFYLRNANDAGHADYTFGYGEPGSAWKPLVGDWNGDGIDTIGFYDPATSTFYLRNTNDAGYADLTFGYGVPGGGWMPRWAIGTATAETIGFFDPA